MMHYSYTAGLDAACAWLAGSGVRLCALGADGEVLAEMGLPVHVSPPEVGRGMAMVPYVLTQAVQLAVVQGQASRGWRCTCSRCGWCVRGGAACCLTYAHACGGCCV